VSSAHQLGEQARNKFKGSFGRPPAAVAVAPGRLNIIGEHTDYNQGWVLPFAIDRHVAVATRPRPDSEIVLQSDRFPAPVRLPTLPPAKRDDWTDYVIGVAREIQVKLGVIKGFEAALVSDVPVGSGLSSSAALEVGTAVSLLRSHGAELSDLEVPRLCQTAENGFVGARTGIMDQFTSALALAGNALLLDCRSLEFDQVPLPERTFGWLLVDTLTKHEHASSGYNQRRSECEAAAAELGVRSLRDATLAQVEMMKAGVLKRRARHILTDNGRVAAASDALRKRDIRALGPLLFSSHRSLRDDFEVSTAELDSLVNLAAEEPAVLGARMMGGGFGGCVVVLLESARIDDVEQHLSQGYTDEFHRAPGLYRVQSVDGALRSRN
jgi:galactokinase